MATVRNVVFGFIAGALAVLVFHQGMYYLIVNYGGPYGVRVSGQPLDMATEPFMPDLIRALKYSTIMIPKLANQMVWGGLWGALFGLLVNRLPGGPVPIKALLFALVGPMLLGSWLLLSYAKSRPIFSGFFNEADARTFQNVRVLATGFLLNGIAFGIGLGFFFTLMRGIGLVPNPRVEHAY